MPEGGRIRIKAEQLDGNFLKLSFSDSGKGILPENIEKIFDPFYTTKSDGTGLGLSIVHRIVKEHDGDVIVHSRIDEGTRFDLILPMVD